MQASKKRKMTFVRWYDFWLTFSSPIQKFRRWGISNWKWDSQFNFEKKTDAWSGLSLAYTKNSLIILVCIIILISHIVYSICILYIIITHIKKTGGRDVTHLPLLTRRRPQKCMKLVHWPRPPHVRTRSSAPEWVTSSSTACMCVPIIYETIQS